MGSAIARNRFRTLVAQRRQIESQGQISAVPSPPPSPSYRPQLPERGGSVLHPAAQGMEEGAQLAVGGPDAPAGLPKGYYVQPTIFASVKPGMTIAREESFGPVLGAALRG